MRRTLLVLDTSYAFEAIRARQLEESVTCRDLNGFFEHVWTVHPFGSLVSDGATTKFGEPEVHRLGEAHTFIDGKIGRFQALGAMPLLNFAASQSDIILRLTSLIRREKISAIRAGCPLYNGLLGLLLARMCGIPLVVRPNANYDKLHAATGKPIMPRLFPSYRIEKEVARFVFSRADLVAAGNQDNLEYALRNGARPEFSTIFRVGNLIDKRHVAPPETRDRSPTVLQEFWSEPYRFILCIGRLERVKHPEDVIRVLAELRKRGHDLKTLMVGDGTEREALAELAKELGVAEHVAFCGNRDQDWLSRVIPLAAAVVSPLSGRALAEAAFGAAPIVAYDLDWQRELIQTNETGVLVPARLWMGMADGVERFQKDPAYARTMGAAARQKAFEVLDPATLDQHERDQYTKLFRRFERSPVLPSLRKYVI
jgi:glycosyltransferase involved in cell wall biosynthesis